MKFGIAKFPDPNSQENQKRMNNPENPEKQKSSPTSARKKSPKNQQKIKKQKFQRENKKSKKNRKPKTQPQNSANFPQKPRLHPLNRRRLKIRKKYLTIKNLIHNLKFSKQQKLGLASKSKNKTLNSHTKQRKQNSGSFLKRQQSLQQQSQKIVKTQKHQNHYFFKSSFNEGDRDQPRSQRGYNLASNKPGKPQPTNPKSRQFISKKSHSQIQNSFRLDQEKISRKFSRTQHRPIPKKRHKKVNSHH